MRKILFNIALLALVFAVGCSEDEDRYAFQESAGLYISSEGLTQLDTEFTIDVEASNSKCTEVTFTPGGAVAISDGAGSLTLTAATYELFDVDSAASFEAVANIEGNPHYSYDITVGDAVSVVDPGIMHSDDMYYFTWDVEPVSATVSNIAIETKVGSAGTYAAVTGTFAAEDSTGFTGTDYDIDVDTIYVKLVATAGSKSTTKITKLTVAPKTFKNVDQFMVDTTTDLALDLIDGRYVESTVEYGDSADLEFDAAYNLTTGLELYFESSKNAEFVVGTATDYSNADIENIEATDFSAAFTKTSALKAGDIFIYRTNRGTGDYSYGVLKVTSVNKPQGVLENSSFEIEVKY